MKRFTLILSLLMAFCFGVNAQVLKVSEAPVNGDWSENTTWYLIQNKKGGYVSTGAAYCNTKGYLSLSNQTAPGDGNENALWCVVGDETNGYQFYNKASGIDKVLYASRNLNSGEASFKMQTKSGAVNEYFDIANSQKAGYIVIKDHNNSNNYWNDRGSNLAYWNSASATNDDGSSFAFFDVEEARILTEQAQNIVETAGVEYSITQLLTKENADDLLYSNACCTDTQWGDQFKGWYVLLDDNSGTFFHSEYAAGKTSLDGLDHYLRVDLGEGNTIEEFQFNYTTRSVGSGECHPKELVVEGSNDNQTYEIIHEYTSGLPNNASLKFSSETMTCKEPYRYLRFRVVSTYLNKKDSGGKAYFYLSEFGLTTVPELSVNPEYNEYKTELVQLYVMLQNAQKTSSNLMERKQVIAELPTLLENIDRVINADFYALYDKIEELRNSYIAYAGEGVGQYNVSDDFVAAVNAAVAVLENSESTASDYQASLVALNALEIPAINLPKDGHFYLFRSVVKENGYMYAALDDNNVGDKDETNKVCWATSTTPANVGIWECEIEDGKIYFKNVHTASYFLSTMTYYPTTLSETEKTAITFEGLGEGQVSVKVNNSQLHAQDNGYVVPWGGGKNTASAWYVEEIASPVNYTLTVGPAGYATLMLGFNTTIPTIEGEDCGVFAATIDGEWAVMNEIEGVLPANTAVIVKAAEDNYTFTYTTETATVENNDLRGTLYNKNITEKAYVLGKDENNVAYLGLAVYNVSTDTTNDGTEEAPEVTYEAWLNNANKAYLPAPANAEGVKSYSLRFDGEGTTAIENVEVDNEVKTIYDLTGRRVVAITAPGIYIVNGKKVLVK